MQSAFGIDHGEISKAAYRMARGGRIAAAASKLTRRNPSKVARAAVPTRTQQVKGKLNRVADAEVSLNQIGTTASRGISGTGNFMNKHPGLTGTALVGGGGAAGYSHLKNKEPKR